MQISKELAGFSGAKADDLRKAIGKKNRAAMAELKPEFFSGCEASGTRARRRRMAVGDQREERRLLVQQVPRRLLRADRLPDRVAEGQLLRRVHGRADQLGHVDQGQGPVLRGALRGDGHRDPAAGRQPVRPRVRRRRRRHPLRARRREGRRLQRRRGDQGGARGGRAVRVDLGLLRARRPAAREQEGDRGAGQVRRVRLDRRDAQGHARGARAGAGRGPEGPAGRADRPGLDLRHARRAGRGGAQRRRGGVRGAVAPADPGRGVRPARPAGGREGVDRAVHLRASAQAGARGAAAEGRRPARRSSRRARTATGSRSAASSRRRARSARAAARR